MAFLKRFYGFLTTRQRVGVLAFFVLAVVSSVVELFGIGLVVLLLQSFAQDRTSGLLAKLEPIVDVFRFGTRYDAQINLILFLVVAYTVRLGVALLYSDVRTRLIVSVQHAAMRRVYRGVMSLPYQAYATIDSAAVLTTLLKVAPRVGKNLLNAILMAGVEATLVIAVVIGLALQEPVTTAAVGIAMFTLYGVVQMVTGRKLRRNGIAENKASVRYQQHVLDSFRGFRDIRIHGLNREFNLRHSRLLDEEAELQRRARLLTETPRLYIETGIVFVVLALVLAQLLLDVPRAEFASRMLVLAVAVARLMPSANRLASAWSSVLHNIGCVQDLENLYRRYPVPDGPIRHAEGPTLRGQIALENVSFAYPDAPTVIDKVSMTIPRHAMAGIIGGSGSGKTTLLEIIAGLLPPADGALMIDGEALSAAAAPGWLERVGYVPQSTMVFAGSIEDNIVFGRPLNPDAVARAVKAAQLEGLLARFPEGIAAQVGDAGDRLSGGERQRIGIARAFYHRPEVLILDEATSALDVNTEAAILASLDALRSETTIIVVAHRLSAVASCDVIYWLDNGRVRAQGDYSAVVSAFSGLDGAGGRDRRELIGHG
ncbi:ABC transporter ATP-binding protein [Alsobacter metallidurans]|uniref:ABC transporter ATP-binding protein n=1 Tax=Alsobacter metallidurans TaxID=340221 RepID=A0A917I5P8_9HYPH|nr:ABC transporter ATP-binding protein [Alsobacter metallidurans]GGH15538.1 ABC transporter ATP-binding protein [Alsobacter metallidurans]